MAEAPLVEREPAATEGVSAAGSPPQAQGLGVQAFRV